MQDDSSSRKTLIQAENLFLHDISTPLTVMLGNLELLELTLAESTDEALKKRLVTTLNSLRKVIAMVNTRKVHVKESESGAKHSA